MPLSQLADSDNLFPIVCAIIVGLVAVLIGIGKIREWIWPQMLGNRMKRFFGAEFTHLKGHEKSFPGYDLATLHRALSDFLSVECDHFSLIGSAAPASTVSDLLVTDRQFNIRARRRAQRLQLERIAVDVDQDESFATNVFYFAQSSGKSATQGRHKFAVLLAVSASRRIDHEDVDERSAPPRELTVSIACKSSAFASEFFRQIDLRRKSLSIYRGKVIDPVVTTGGIQTIAFRNIARVTADDLVLAPSVRELILGSIVSFYTHQETLRSVGVEMKRGILFHSQPGTGKTSISLYLAGLLPKFTICFVSGKRLLFPRELCSMARYLQPTMLVFEDIDLIAQERDMNGLATVLGELMNQIDGCEPNDQVLFIMNTNSMDRLEEAVRNRPGRVDQIIRIPLPDLEERRQLIQRFSRAVSTDADAINALATASEDVTPAVLKEVVKRAVVMAVSQPEVTGNDGNSKSERQIILRKDDLLLSLEQVLSLRTKPRATATADRPAIGF